MTDDQEICKNLGCDAFSLLMTVLQLGQFVPQHIEMAIDKSVVGVSPWLLFFGGLYTHLAALDSMISASHLFSCNEGIFRCFIDAQPQFQQIGSAVLSSTMWYWYLKYYSEGDDVENKEDDQELEGNFFYAKFSARAFFDLFLYLAALFTLVAGALVLFLGTENETTLSYAWFCGITSACLNAIMWIPQIYVTLSYRHKGALSFWWVLSSIIMDVVYSIYLARMGFNFSVWANNIPDGVQTGILLILVLYFEWQDEVKGLDNFGHVIHGSVMLAENVQPRMERGSSTLREALEVREYGSIDVQ